MKDERSRLLFVGQIPPPANGMTITTQTLLDSSFAERFELLHLDTSDHRSIDNVGTLDRANVYLAVKHGLQFLMLLARRPRAVYLPIACNRLGVLRDLLFLLPARLARRPVIVHFHSLSFCDYWQSESALMRRLIALAFGPRVNVVVLGERLRGAFGTLVGPERVHAVPNGLPDLGEGPPAAERKPIVLHLATMWSEKGLFDVLRAAVRVRDAFPEVRFVLAGGWYSDAERRQALHFVQKHGLDRVVEFVGPVEDEAKRRLLQSASTLMFPSKVEGQPLVVVEALAAGTPVITTAVGSLPETFDDAIEGFLVPRGDVEALAGCCLTLLRDSALRSEMGQAARRRYERYFQAERFAQRLGDTIEALLETEPPSTERAEPPVIGVE